MSTTVTGTLIYGIEQGDAVHTEFVMRAATVADVIAAVEQAGENPTSLRLRVFKLAEQLERIGEIPGDNITGEMLLQLPEDDIEPLFDAQDEIAKKQKSLRLGSSHTDNSK